MTVFKVLCKKTPSGTNTKHLTNLTQFDQLGTDWLDRSLGTDEPENPN